MLVGTTSPLAFTPNVNPPDEEASGNDANCAASATFSWRTASVRFSPPRKKCDEWSMLAVGFAGFGVAVVDRDLIEQALDQTRQFLGVRVARHERQQRRSKDHRSCHPDR